MLWRHTRHIGKRTLYWLCDVTATTMQNVPCTAWCDVRVDTHAACRRRLKKTKQKQMRVSQNAAPGATNPITWLHERFEWPLIRGQVRNYPAYCSHTCKWGGLRFLVLTTVTGTWRRAVWRHVTFNRRACGCAPQISIRRSLQLTAPHMLTWWSFIAHTDLPATHCQTSQTLASF